MQIVIELSDETYKDIKEENGIYGINNGLSARITGKVVGAIQSGTPFPKGHGKIVDIGKIDNDRIEKDNPVIYLTVNGEYIEAVSLDYLNGLPAIIEADKERE